MTNADRQAQVSGLKKWISGLVLLSVLFGVAGASAQGDVVVWTTLSPEGGAIIPPGIAPAPVAVDFVEPPLLADAAMKAAAGGQPPDVFLAGHDAIAPLLEQGLAQPVAPDQALFLTLLLEELPGLVKEQCGDNPVQECLWGEAPSALRIPALDDKTLRQTEAWLCEATPWLAFCPDGAKPGAALGWSFQIFLISDEWLMDNGLKPPTTVDELFQLRGKYRLGFKELSPRELDVAESPDRDTVYIVNAGLLLDDAEGMMAALAQFARAGYEPVVGLDVFGLYVWPDASDAAQQVAQSLARSEPVILDLSASAHVLPAFDPPTLLKTDPVAALTTLRALSLLHAYAAMAY